MSEQTPTVHRLPADRAMMPGPFGSSDSLDHAWRVAQALAASPIVPEHLRNPHSILVAVQIAASNGEDLFSVLQGMQVIKGKIGWSGTYLLSRINRSGLYPDGVGIETSGQGDALAVTVKGVRRNGRVDAFTVSLATAKADGWTSNPKYRTIPEIMLTNRAIGFFLRYRCPEVMTGATVADELDDRTELQAVAPTVTVAAKGRRAMPRALADRSAEQAIEQERIDAMTRVPDAVPVGDGFAGEET